MPIIFKFAPRKARAAIQWMLTEKTRLDLHAMLKACYFADKAHLNAHGRPIFGACYRAMRYGPVPLEIYEMAKREPYWLPELNADRYPWALEGSKLALATNDPIEMDVLSETDQDELAKALQQSCTMSFTERTAATHGPDWQAANLGMMRYEDMLDDTPDKAERIRYLEQTGRYLKL